MRRSYTCADPLYSTALGGYARVLFESAGKLVCGGLQHWESFVINLLGGNARTHYILAVTRESKREFLTRPDYFCDSGLGSTGLCGAIYSVGDLLEYQRQCRDIHFRCWAKRNVLTIRATRRLDLEYDCGKRATSFYVTSEREIR